MRIAVTGGKGGTGKSTIAAALAVELAKRKRVLLVDADADCPNDHLILSLERKLAGEVKVFVPKINDKSCIKCGKCSEVCRKNALIQVKGRLPLLVEELCIGCGACWTVCPVGAIGKVEKVVGKVWKGKVGKLDFLGGELFPGMKESAVVVDRLKDFIRDDDYDFVIIDTAAGTHCPVVSAMLGCQLAIGVTEPTPLGAHDLKLILKLLEVLKIEGKVILNRAGVGDDGVVEKMCGEAGTEIVEKIPYSDEIAKAYSRGEVIEIEAVTRLARILEGKG